jgi:hypothetical protein
MSNVYDEIKKLLDIKGRNFHYLKKRLLKICSDFDVNHPFQLLFTEEIDKQPDIYYFICDVFHSSLGMEDAILLYEIYSHEEKSTQHQIKFGHILSLLYGSFIHLEKVIYDLIKHPKLSVSEKIRVLNTYKRETFDFWRAIKPKYLQSLSTDLINSINLDKLSRNDFREDMSRIIADELPSIKPIISEDSNLIIIVLEDFYSYHRSTVNKLILDWVYSIRKFHSEYKIKIINTLDFYTDGSAICGQRKNREVIYKDIMDDLALSCKETVDVEFIYRPINVDLISWIKNILELEVILSVVSFPSPRWPLLKLLKSVVPVVAVELANGLNLKDMATITLPNGKITQSVVDKYNDCYFEADFPQIPFPQKEHYNRSDFDLAEDAFVIASVGRHLFSRSAIDINIYMEGVCKLLASSEKLVWYFIGEEAETSLFNKKVQSLIAEKRILISDYESDLIAFFEICDLFAMPAIQGGGRGIGLAASVGLPCISFSISDGSKSFPNELVFDISDMDGYFSNILELMNDKTSYSHVANVCKKIFGTDLYERSAQQMIEACQLANRKFCIEKL